MAGWQPGTFLRHMCVTEFHYTYHIILKNGPLTRRNAKVVRGLVQVVAMDGSSAAAAVSVGNYKVRHPWLRPKTTRVFDAS